MAPANEGFKVRAFPRDIGISTIMPSLCWKKRPSYVILMAGTNDSINKSSEEILVELLQLRTFIESNCPDCKVVISRPTDRFDAAKAKLTVMHLRRKLNNLKIPIILNDNITDVQRCVCVCVCVGVWVWVWVCVGVCVCVCE